MKSKVLKIVGVLGIVFGSGAFYLAGTTESTVAGIVAGVFVLAGLIVQMLKE